MYTDTGTTELTEGQCMKYGIHYGYATHALYVGTANAIMREGADSWFFITADYPFGHSLKDNAINVVTQQGGKVLGSVTVPLGTSDFSSFLLQAPTPGAKVVYLEIGR